MDSLVILLPKKAQFWVGVLVGIFTIAFGTVLIYGSYIMAVAVADTTIPTLGITESARYVPPIIAGVFIILFSIEHLIAMFTKKEVISSWH